MKNTESWVINKGLAVPPKPSNIMREKYSGLPEDLTKVSNRKLGRLLGVYASFAEFSDYELAKLEGVQERLDNDLELLSAEIMALNDDGKEKWRLEAAVQRNKKYQSLRKKRVLVSTKVRILKALKSGYDRKHSTVSREITRRGMEMGLFGKHRE